MYCGWFPFFGIFHGLAGVSEIFYKFSDTIGAGGQKVRRFGLIFLAVMLISAVAQDAAGQTSAQASQASPKAAAPKRHYLSQTVVLLAKLNDKSVSDAEKAIAAAELVSMPRPKGPDAVLGVLKSGNPAAMRAVMGAIVSTGRVDDSYIKPLAGVLVGKDQTLRLPAALALAAFDQRITTEYLITISLERRNARDIRLTAIKALGRIISKYSVDVLVHLMADRDAAICSAAGKSMAALTGRKSFKTDFAAARAWWIKNRGQGNEWTIALTRGLTDANNALGEENDMLRSRLLRAIREMYGVTAADRREELAISLLKDPLADVRLAGANVVEMRISSGEKMSPPLKAALADLLADDDSRVRRSVALLVAHDSDSNALAKLMGQMRREDVLEVKEGILVALGQIGSSQALGVVLKEIPSQHDRVAAAAAAALRHIATNKTLEGEVLSRATEILSLRYQQVRPGPCVVMLKEALLGAMGALRQKVFVGHASQALGDASPAVRLAGVVALANIGDGLSADKIVPLTMDKDRGVRRAAISALGSLAGQKHIRIIMARTDIAVEPDEEVRKQAWNVAMAVLSSSTAESLAGESRRLVGRADAVDQQIEILRMLVSALDKTSSSKAVAARRELGDALLAASRPAQAAGVFKKAWEDLAKAKDPQAGDVWLMWIETLAACDDPTVAKLVFAQEDKTLCDKARDGLIKRVKTQLDAGDFTKSMSLGQIVVRDLGPKLTKAQTVALNKHIAEAKAVQAAVDTKIVKKLVADLAGKDPVVRDKAISQLKGMANKAVAPLLNELKRIVNDGKDGDPLEAAILGVLKQIAANFDGYDVSAAKADRLKMLDNWLKLHAR